MPTIDTRVTNSEASADSLPSAACPACSHEWSAHDQISARYCKATAAGSYSRGCVCPGANKN
ncbi:RGCVC family protein [Actinokineospora sp.]|uniref:RGCVC family protein n=1 Tax=Actinokineospora sp. TaxID=1872133 RepID=UPI003D6B13A6